MASPIHRVVESLAAAAGLDVTWLDGPGEELVSVVLPSVPLAVVLDRVLGHRNYLLSPAAGGRRAGLWIGSVIAGREPANALPPAELVPRGGAPTRPMTGDDDVSALLAHEATDDPDAARRRDAVAQLAGLPYSVEARTAVTHALARDSSSAVRMAALAALDQLYSTPVDALIAASRNDPNERVRLRAMELLLAHADEDTAANVLSQIARNDPSNGLRRRAANALEQVHRR